VVAEDDSDPAHPVPVVEAMVVVVVDMTTTIVVDLLVDMAETAVATVDTVTDHLLVAATTKMTTDVAAATAIVVLLLHVAVAGTVARLTTTLLVVVVEVADTEMNTHHQPVADMVEAVPLMMIPMEATAVAEVATMTDQCLLAGCLLAEALLVMDMAVAVAMVTVLPAEAVVTRCCNGLGQPVRSLEVPV